MPRTAMAVLGWPGGTVTSARPGHRRDRRVVRGVAGAVPRAPRCRYARYRRLPRSRMMMGRGDSGGGDWCVVAPGLAGVGCKRSVVDEAGHALSTQRRWVFVCIDREVRERVATDRMQNPAR